MPHTHVALIRGINVGTAKRIAMADLRAMVEGLGYTNVRTVLNSGNVVFDGPRDDPADAAALPDGGALVLERRFSVFSGFGGRVVRLTAAQLSDAGPGAVLEGEEVLRLSPPLPTENYEAIAAFQHGGRTFLAVLADDNENMLQRSLLLLFACPGQ